jgi:hypothetical protein
VLHLADGKTREGNSRATILAVIGLLASIVLSAPSHAAVGLGRAPVQVAPFPNIVAVDRAAAGDASGFRAIGTVISCGATAGGYAGDRTLR